jgi:peptidoglycan/xylan/chitin deacetylase (PgdA/CDA1 family)
MKGLRRWLPGFHTRQSILLPVAAAGTLMASLSIWALPAVPAAASTPVVVTLGFDDGTVDQFTNGFPILQAHGMHAPSSSTPGRSSPVTRHT